MYATITIDIMFFTSSDRIGGVSPKTMSLGCVRKMGLWRNKIKQMQKKKHRRYTIQ
jgi:hypothetical protein